MNGDLDILDGIFAPGGTGTSVGMNVGSGKTLDATGGTLKATGARFLLQDATDATKKATFGLAGIPTATTRDYALPPASDTLVGAAQAQVLTNKTAPDPPAADNTQALVPAHWVNAAIAAAVNAALAAYSAYSTGDVMASSNGSKPGWVQLRGGTLGTAGSGATARANADCLALFSHFWTINSSSWPINGGRGTVSAAADFAALKTITLPNMDGMVLAGLGGALGLSSYFTSTGAATVALTVANLPAHHHDLTMTPTDISGGGGPFTQFMAATGTTSTTDTGSGTPHSNVQPSMGVYFWCKL